MAETLCIHDYFEGRCVHCLRPSPHGRQSEKGIDFQPRGHFAKKDSVSERVCELEVALRYWSGYDDVEFAIKQAKARGELTKPDPDELDLYVCPQCLEVRENRPICNVCSQADGEVNG